MKNKDLGDIDEKFLFNIHCFDEGYEEEEEDLPPPPPMFSEEELASEKAKSYQEGMAQARKEEINSREAATTKVLNKIANDSALLFAAEADRERKYELEVIQLTLRFFQSLYPFYHERCGFEELEKTLSDVLKSHRHTKAIEVFVQPDLKDMIEESLQGITNTHSNLTFTVIADKQIADAACRIKWEDGGAHHDPAKMATEILGILKQTLADEGISVHDDEACEQQETQSEKSDIIQGNDSQDHNPDEDPSIMETPDE